jgi:hypothetical protein
MWQEDEQALVAGLAAKYPVFAESTIRRWVSQEMAKYRSAAIQIYVPMLVRRSVDATLRELARAEGTSTDALTLA